jgi:hypothetical protein
MPQFRFTIEAVFEDEHEFDAYDQWREWLTDPAHVEEGTKLYQWEEVK